jgi:peptidylprolyl isomerase
MLSSKVKRLLLVVGLAVGLSAAGCERREGPKAEAPAEAPAEPTAAVEQPQAAEEPGEEDEAVTAARDLGTPSDNPAVTTDSGLKYIEVKEGAGVAATAGDMVSVHYTGWLVNGTKFDSSIDRGAPFEFSLGAGRVIKGWDEGVAGMKTGAVRKLIIPPDLGYGSRSVGPIPPDSTLIFEVELINVG